MSLLFGDQDAEEAQAAGKRLGMLFDTEDTSTQDAASTTFKYEPESKPKPAPSKGSGAMSARGYNTGEIVMEFGFEEFIHFGQAPAEPDRFNKTVYEVQRPYAWAAPSTPP